MQIAVDRNQLTGKHELSNRIKHEQLERLGVELVPLPLPFGDYALIDDDVRAVVKAKGDKIAKKDLQDVIKKSVDTKKDLQELAGNVTGQHERFKRELIKADGRLTILIEHGTTCSCLEDVKNFYQEPKTRYRAVKRSVCGKTVFIKEAYEQKAINGESLYKSLMTIKTRYRTNIEFCTRNDAGEQIIRILTNDS